MVVIVVAGSYLSRLYVSNLSRLATRIDGS